MIQEFIKEYRKLRYEYQNMPLDNDDGNDDLWMCDAMEDLVCRYETELNIQSLKELNNETIRTDTDTI